MLSLPPVGIKMDELYRLPNRYRSDIVLYDGWRWMIVM